MPVHSDRSMFVESKNADNCTSRSITPHASPSAIEPSNCVTDSTSFTSATKVPVKAIPHSVCAPSSVRLTEPTLEHANCKNVQMRKKWLISNTLLWSSSVLVLLLEVCDGRVELLKEPSFCGSVKQSTIIFSCDPILLVMKKHLMLMCLVRLLLDFSPFFSSRIAPWLS